MIKDDVSVGSMNSAASSVHEIVVFETSRRKEVLNKIRNRRKKAKAKSHDSVSLSSDSTTGIMTVRTVEESLGESKVTKMRKLRRKITIQFKSVDGGSVEGEDISVSTKSVSSVLGDIACEFSKVQIREYEVVPGHNPSCTSGPPLELGWGHGEIHNFDLDRYEHVRDGRRRLQAQMRMPPDERRGLLLHHGSSQRMIREATKACAAGRKQRIQTLESLNSKKNSKGVKGIFKLGKKT